MEMREADAVAADNRAHATSRCKAAEIGVIPTDWCCVSANEIAAKRPNAIVGGPFGSDLVSKDYVSAGVPVIRGQNMSRRLVSGEFAFVTKSKARQLEANLARPGDIVFTQRGTLGQVAIVPNDSFAQYVISQSQMKLSVNTDLASANFILHYFLSSEGQKQIIDSAIQTGIPHTNLGILRSYQVPLPASRREQEAIAEALSDADALIESLEQLLAKKRNIKQGAMQELLTGKKRLPGFRGSWVRKCLGDLALLSKAGVNPASTPNTQFTHFSLPAFDAGRVPIIEQGEHIGSNKFIVPQNAILVSKLNPRITRVWAPSYIPANAVCSTEFLVLVASEAIHRNFLAYLCSSPAVCVRMKLHAIGTTGSHQRIHPSQVLAIEVRIPENEIEQGAVAAALADMDAEIAALEAKLTKARQLKQGMMQELLTGRIRLVRPDSNVVSLSDRKRPSSTGSRPHNQQIEEAAILGVLSTFGTEQYPLARVRRTKLLYLLQRHLGQPTDAYLKKAAGPYKPSTRYKGPEGIAVKNGYVRVHHNGVYEGFVSGSKVSQARAYVEKWHGAEALSWLEQLRFKKTDELELLATVDMAMQELLAEAKSVTLLTVKRVIRDHPEWEAKLEREVFSDKSLARAIQTCNELFA